MPLKARADAAEREQLTVGDRAARFVDGIEQRRRVSSGWPKSYRRYFEIRTAINSAADIDDVGWPDFGTALARMESMRSCCASSRQSTTSAAGFDVAARGSSELETRITSFAGFQKHRHSGGD
jgi:hypothetical protein